MVEKVIIIVNKFPTKNQLTVGKGISSIKSQTNASAVPNFF
jgi:hypothetical protein